MPLGARDLEEGGDVVLEMGEGDSGIDFFFPSC